MKKIKVMTAFGTRPEAIKMCPLVKRLERTRGIESVVCLTGQHRQMLDPVTALFDVRADHDLNIMRPGQSLAAITADILLKMQAVLAAEGPDIVLVHGDAASSTAVALAAFYEKIPVGHVEAGLRSGDRYSPFPEEMNRRLTAQLATLHFAPTEQNAANLRREGVGENIFVTGNTVMDAFRTTVRPDYRFKNEALAALASGEQRLVLVTAHRRENLGEGLENICRAVRRLAESLDDAVFIWPVHLNPAVRGTVMPMLGGVRRVHLIEPLEVQDMHNLIARSHLVMTDSGGLQEEAPACGVPVLVMRAETERPETVQAGTARVVGVRGEDIFREAHTLLTDDQAYRQMAHTAAPYGDGHASGRIVQHLLDYFGERTAAK